MRKTNYLQVNISGLQRTAGPYRYAKRQHDRVSAWQPAKLGTRSMRQQDGQGGICQDVLGCPAEYHLSQPALRVGALNEKVATQ
jgi:hypothetical protein